MLCFIFIIVIAVSLQGVQSFFYNGSSNDSRHGLCGQRSVRQAEFNWNSPERSMTESFVLDDVEYKLSKYHVTWDEALVFCSSHRAHLAILDSEEKTAFVVQAIASSSSVSEDYWIGASKLYDNPWRWNSNGMRLSFESDIVGNLPVMYPGFDTNDIHCLTIDRSGHDEPIFVPQACNQRRGFICQRDTDRAFDSKIRMVAASRIGEQEFRLYAGRATWTEAVVQCRQEGLQIGEVNTVEEARALGLAMLRNRPEGIESAWIGGYTRNDEPSTWRWLASGKKIANSQMWGKNVSESSGGCLLLDRHICESPVYVESTCERKRDILCQKPPKKWLGESPVAVLVDDCPYWIGFFPLKWSDARRSCQFLNASLVVLDSPATISHMMSLMLDNKADLRHIWTDGSRSKIDGQWKWFVTGEAIPSFGDSFMPWCPEDDYYAKESVCLNLDRENLDTPLVYGLPCREKQPYVCQPRAGACVLHPAPDVSSDASEDVQKRPAIDSPPFSYEDTASLSTSTITTSYPTLRDSYAVLQTTIGPKSDEPVTWIPSDNFTYKNSSSHPNFAQFLTPLARFTLPTLPQFGIKVVSATEATTNTPSFDIGAKKSKGYKFPTTSSQPSDHTTSRPPSSLSISAKKIPSEARKVFKPSPEFPAKPSSPSATPGQSEAAAATEKSPEIANPSSPPLSQASPIPWPLSPSKNASKSSKASRISSSTPKDAATTKHSAKTTRDISSSITATTTTKPPNAPISITVKKSKSSPKNATRNSTFGNRRLNVHDETTTPDDVVDENYYDNGEVKVAKKNVDKSAKSAKKPDDEDDDNESNEYFEDYGAITSGKSKKKSKQSSASSLRKKHKESSQSDEDEEEEEEDEEEYENEDRKPKASALGAAELSKTLENALVNIIKEGMEKKDKKKAALAYATMKNTKNRNYERAHVLKEEALEGPTLNQQERKNSTKRPVYAFEGPMVAFFPKYRGAEGGGRQFVFVGKKMNNENFQISRAVQGRKSMNASLRRANVQQPSERRNFPVSMSGMPDIRPEDPKSMMQLGRYFKNKFQGFAQNPQRFGDSPRVKSSRVEVERGGRRRFGPHSQGRVRERPAKQKGALGASGRRWEIPEGPKVEPSYHEGGRRLYARGNYELGAFVARQSDGPNQRTLREQQQQRLDVAWPDNNLLNRSNVGDSGRAISQQRSPLSVRTIRSFREASKLGKADATNGTPFPEFKLSKLVKEVRIDLDQRMLRRYLEGFAKKIVGTSPGPKGDDWKKTWRMLLEQMLSLLNRMNVNVNGDVMKLKVGDEGEQKLLGLHQKPLKDSKKQSKAPANAGKKNGADKQKKSNETRGSKLENSARAKNPAQTNAKAQIGGKTTTKSPLGVNEGKENSAMGHDLGYQKVGNKSSLNYEGAAGFVGEHYRQLSNRFQTKFTNQSNLRKVQGSQDFAPAAKLPTVFRLHPLEPQQQPGLAFQPARNQIHGSVLGMSTFDAKHSPEAADSYDEGPDDGNVDFGNSTLDADYNATYADFDADGGIIGEEENHREGNGEAVVPEDYEQRPTWSSTHRLAKALELSVLRKFGASPSSTMMTKKLVTRSVKKIETSPRARKIVETLESLQDEPSIVSLSMKITPEQKSSRILRQSKGSPGSASNPRSLEVNVQFSGKEPNDAERISSRDAKNSAAKGKNPKALGTTKRPIRFVDKGRQRETLERQRERNGSEKKNYIRSYPTSKVNTTASGARKNTLGGAGASKKIPETKHRPATSLRSFNEKKATNDRENKSKKVGKSRGNDQGIDWNKEASALFADLKESSGDLTLYIDLTLGRVGSKPRNRKSKEKP